VRTDRQFPRNRQLQRRRQLGGVVDQFRQAAIDDALAVALFQRIGVADTQHQVLGPPIDMAEHPGPLAELGDKRDFHSEVAAHRMQRLAQHGADRHIAGFELRQHGNRVDQVLNGRNRPQMSEHPYLRGLRLQHNPPALTTGRPQPLRANQRPRSLTSSGHTHVATALAISPPRAPG